MARPLHHFWANDRALSLLLGLLVVFTLGYGDITPVQPFARSLAQLEALIGQLFPAVLLARLVSMELLHRRAGRPDATDDRR